MLRFKHHLTLIVDLRFLSRTKEKFVISIFKHITGKKFKGGHGMTLAEGIVGDSYKVIDVETDDEELKDFLFTLGCYSGEEVTIISRVSENIVVSIRDGRYSLSHDLAETILV